MDLSIVMTFKSDGGIKDKHLSYILKRYNYMFPEAEIIVQVDDETDKSKQWLDFNKSKQLNLAVKRSTRNNLLLVDIDMLISKESILEAYNEITLKKFILMAGRLVELDEPTTMAILSTKVSDELPDVNTEIYVSHVNNGLMANGCYMITKELYWKCTGHDERFVGWGSEDAAFILCAVTMNGNRTYRMKYDVYHMWHTRSGDRPRSGISWEIKEKLMVMYSEALYKKDKMLKVLETKEIKNKNNILMCMYVVGGYDVQRGIYWKENIQDLMPLINSLKGQKLIVLNNCFEDGLKIESAEFVRIKNTREPYRASWYLYRDYLKEHTEIDYVWHIDSTDVEMLKNPFEHMLGEKIYVGSEEQVVGCDWLSRTTVTPLLLSFVITYKKKKLLNAGLLGGSREDVLDFCSDMCRLYDGECSEEATNMPIFNYLAYRKYRSKIEYGSHINTEFKAYDKSNTVAWFRHK